MLQKGLQKKMFFKSFWLCAKFYGLQYYKLNKNEKYRAIILFITCYVAHIVLMVLHSTSNYEQRFEAIKVIPSMVLLGIDAVNFLLKSRSIETVFNEICEIYERSDQQRIFDLHYKKAVKITAILGGLIFCPILARLFVFILTGETKVPIYMLADHGPIFFATWTIQAGFFMYVFVIFYLLDSLLIIFLSIFNGYSATLRLKFQNANRRKDLVNCIQDHLEFKR